jgi:GPH family glycoside/pentoside/hexuronide:cation symporter
VTEGARDAIRWTYYGGTVALLALQVLVVMFWPMDGLHDRIREDVSARRPVTA